MYKTISMFKEPVDEIKKLPYVISQMTDWEKAFLCGLLKTYHPKKILEVGVYKGGGTVLLSECMKKIGLDDYVIHSVDLAKESGECIFQYINENQIEKNMHNRFYFGNILPEIIDEIGKEIDFVILDTVHQAPGELLDLLCVLPYLAQDAVICFHDLALDYNNNSEHGRQSYIPCTINKLIFDCITGDKIFHINSGDPNMLYGYPNIGAIVINESTRSNVYDLFSLFSSPWCYIPEEYHINLYSAKYLNLYGEELASLFDKITKMNRYLISARNESKKKDDYILEQFNSYVKNASSLYLYGCGSRGCKYKQLIESMSCDITGFVVSDGHKTNSSVAGKNVYTISEAIEREGKNLYIIVTTTFSEVIDDLNSRQVSFFNPDDRLQEIFYERKKYFGI